MLHHYPVEMLQTADIAPRSLERAARSEQLMHFAKGATVLYLT